MKEVNSQRTGLGHEFNTIIHINLHSHTNPLTDFVLRTVLSHQHNRGTDKSDKHE